MDEFLKKYAYQNGINGSSQTFVAVEQGQKLVRGYYSISAASVTLDSLSEEQRKWLPKYPVPVAHLGRLAVDESTKGQRLGEQLLIDALRRIDKASQALGIHAVDVVAIEERAKSFWIKYGFTELLDNKLHLYMPLRKLRKLGLT